MNQTAEIGTFLAVGGSQLYCVRHQCAKPRAIVVLAGPFFSERPFFYAPWVRWARYLAANGFEVVRFDYRGVGESTGSFQSMNFQTWAGDIQAVSDWIQAHLPSVPLVLHGLGLGGLLAANRFDQGLANALLLWSAPTSGEDVLREGLMRRLSIEYIMQPNGQRKSYEDYVSELKAGGVLQVEGYPWSRHLWEDASQFRLAATYSTGAEAVSADGKPWKHVKLDKSHVPLVSGLGQWQALNPRAEVRAFPLNPDFSGFFAQNLTWIQSATKLSPQEA
jgi:pimeloyl-ACP methyl ester carboxylesterase